MKYKYDLHGLGREIENSVRNAVRPEDVQHLKGSLDDIMRELSDMGRELSKPLGAPIGGREPRAPQNKGKAAVDKPEKNSVSATPPPIAPTKKPRRNGRWFWGWVLSIWGWSLVLSFATLLFSLIAAITFMPAPIPVLLFLLSGSAGCGILIPLLTAKGASMRHEYRRFPEYQRLFEGCKLYPVERLSIAMDCSKRQVIRDLRRMIHTGKLPGAHLDVDRTTIILDEETYEQYLQMEQRRRTLGSTGKKASTPAEPAAAPAPVPTPADLSPLDALIGEGRDYIDRINATNPIIDNEEVSQKIELIAATVSKIFDYVAEHPEKQGDLRRLMSYYLPTTLKLLESYSKFEAHAVRGENVSTAMREIEGALDTICLAFENLLDDLFEHEMYDITSDISALESVLAQEGLTAQSFAANEPKNTQGGLQ